MYYLLNNLQILNFKCLEKETGDLIILKYLSNINIMQRKAGDCQLMLKNNRA